MEQRKDELKKEYNLAAELFNEKKYDLFLRNIRPVISSMSIFMIYDMLDNEDKARDLISGNISFAKDKSTNSFYLQEYRAKYPPSSRDYSLLMYKTYLSIHPDYCAANADLKKKELKAAMTGYGEGLTGLYSVTSEWAHPEACNLDAYSQAFWTASYLNSFIDFIKSKKVLSPSSISFVLSLSKFDFGNTREIEDQEGKIIELSGKIKDLEINLKDRNDILSEKNEKIKELESRIKESSNEDGRTKAYIGSLESDNKKYADEVEACKKQIENKDLELNRLTAELEKIRKECADAHQQVEEEKKIRKELEATLEAKRQESSTEEEEITLDNLFDQQEEPEIDLFANLFDQEEEDEEEERPVETEDINDPSLRRVLNWVNQGMSATQIRDASRAKPQNTYKRLAILVEKGYADAKRFLSEDIYDEIYEAIKEVGTSAEKQEIKDYCSSRIALWQISLVLAELKYKRTTIEPDKWEFVTGISHKPAKASKWLFHTTSHKCRVVRSPKGYYLQVGNEYIKLGNYPRGIDPDAGSIWLMGFNSIGKEIVHDTGDVKHLVGYIRDEKKRIVFTTPDKNEKYITFG